MMAYTKTKHTKRIKLKNSKGKKNTWLTFWGQTQILKSIPQQEAKNLIIISARAIVIVNYALNIEIKTHNINETIVIKLKQSSNDQAQ